MVLSFFAHAGEQHSDTTEGLAHWLESSSNAILAWIVIGAFVFIVLHKGFNLSRANSLLLFAFLNFVYGIFLYSTSPAVGAVVLSTGFAVTLWTVINGLHNDTKGNVHGRQPKKRTGK